MKVQCPYKYRGSVKLREADQVSLQKNIFEKQLGHFLINGGFKVNFSTWLQQTYGPEDD